MKKVLSLLLTAIMYISLCTIPVSAAEEDYACYEGTWNSDEFGVLTISDVTDKQLDLVLNAPYFDLELTDAVVQNNCVYGEAIDYDYSGRPNTYNVCISFLETGIKVDVDMLISIGVTYTSAKETHYFRKDGFTLQASQNKVRVVDYTCYEGWWEWGYAPVLEIYDVQDDSLSFDLTIADFSVQARNVPIEDGCVSGENYWYNDDNTKVKNFARLSFSDKGINVYCSSEGPSGYSDNSFDATKEGVFIFSTKEIVIQDLFRDLDKSHWAYNNIKALVERGIIDGYDDGTFRPEMDVNRAEWAKMLATSEGLYQTDIKPVFADVSRNEWFAPYVYSVYPNFTTHMSQVGDGSDASYKPVFEPYNPATREEVVKTIVKAKGYDVSNPNYSLINGFADYNSISEEARKYLAVAVEKGIIDGYDDNTFKPGNAVKRSEVATILLRVLNLGN